MRIKGIITTLLSGILMVLVLSSCICDLIKNEEEKRIPDFHFYCEFGDTVYDEEFNLTILDNSSRYGFDCDEYKPHSCPNRSMVRVDYYLRMPFFMSLVILVDSTAFLKNKHVYRVQNKPYLPETHEYALNGNIMRKYDVEACTFSFELPDPKDTLVAYSFLFDMELNDGVEAKQIRNGKITFYKKCPDVSSFIYRIKD